MVIVVHATLQLMPYAFGHGRLRPLPRFPLDFLLGLRLVLLPFDALLLFTAHLIDPQSAQNCSVEGL